MSLSGLRVLASMYRYPDSTYHARVVQAIDALAQAGHEDAVAPMEQFSQWVASRSQSELEEGYTQTFDLSPKCSAEVGWHVFGEDYARGAFMVEIRQLLREYEVPEDTELPDHISHMLLLIDAMATYAGRHGIADRATAEAALRIIDDAINLALEKMLEALEKNASDFLPLMRATSSVLADVRASIEPHEVVGASSSPTHHRNGHSEVAHD